MNRKLYGTRAAGGYALSTKAMKYLEQRRKDLLDYVIDSCEEAICDADNVKYVGCVRSTLSLACVHAVTLLPGERRSECSCRTPAIRSLPCVHACKLATGLHVNIELLVHDGYTNSAGQAAFSDPAQTAAVDTANLEPAQDFLTPPVNVPKRGRPSKKRKLGHNESTQAGKKRSRKVSRCAGCGHEGHSLRTCPQLSA